VTLKPLIMDHETRIRKELNKIVAVEELRPNEQQAARRITQNVFNMSYIIWALTMLFTVGAFMYVIGGNTATLQDVKQNQRLIMVYFSKEQAEREAQREEAENE